MNNLNVPLIKAKNGIRKSLRTYFFRCLMVSILFILFSISLTTSAFANQAAAADPSWNSLITRLQADGIYTDDVKGWVANLPAYSAEPMGGKIRSVFRYRYTLIPFRFFYKPKQTLTVHPGFASQANVIKCVKYLETYKEVFDRVEAQYHVPRRAITSLLMVETKLGIDTGRSPAFWSLASMASTETPESISQYLKDYRMTEERSTWVKEQLNKRSLWAYKELKALLLYCHKNGHDPLKLKGSVYGAIGYCQFMPTNIPAYAADGDGDGKIDVFSHPDAIFSVARYLNVHGWKSMDLSDDRQKELFRKYNHSTVYANTISGVQQAIIKYERDQASKVTPANSDIKSQTTNNK